MRIACLRVADLALAAELRASPELHGHPVAIASGSDGRAEVVAASPEALRDLIVSHFKFAVMATEAEDRDTACRELRECQEILGEIEQAGWADAQTRQDRELLDACWSKWGCGKASEDEPDS